MSVFDAFLLAILQGVTEFLPISSSGHLVIAQSLLNIHSEALIGFDVYVHFGTLISVLIIFWNDVRAMFVHFFTSVMKRNIIDEYKSSDPFRHSICVLVGTLPAVFVGLLFRHQLEELFHDPKLVSVNLVITGLILFLTRLARSKEDRKVTLVVAFLIGLAQAVAVMPGISRSGTTIAMGLFLGLTPALSARFSFLLSIPVIAGAAILELKNISYYSAELGLLPIIVGFVVSIMSGYVAIRFLLQVLKRGKFSYFAFYCLIVGIIGILYV